MLLLGIIVSAIVFFALLPPMGFFGLLVTAIVLVFVFSTFMRLWFIVGVLPFFIFQHGFGRFKEYMNKHNAWWQLPYMLLGILAILLILLLANGYTW